MGKVLAGLITGAIFGVGLALGGMTQPSKVIGFLDVAGAWDPSLALVMAGAVGVYAPAYQFLKRQVDSRFTERFSAVSPIDGSLVVGAALFGLGWGMAGYCPGPAVVAAGTGAPEALIFAVSMIAGMMAFVGWQRFRERARVENDPAGARA